MMSDAKTKALLLGGAGVMTFTVAMLLAASASASEGDGIPTEPLPTKGTLVLARRTPLTRSEIMGLVIAEYRRRYGSTLTKAQAAVLVAQWGIETGWGRSTFNFNFGNVKAGAGWTGQFVILKTYEYHKRDGVLVKERWRAPFRAYRTPEEGVAAWMGILFGQRHGRSRSYVLAPDPAGFGRSLANVNDGGTGYGTVRADHYASAIRSAHASIMAA